MVDAGHRPQGRLRRRPLPLRAFLPPSAPLPPDLQDLQSLLRVPQLRHRGADRRGGRGARLRAAPERAADPRHLRGLPDRPAAASRRGASTELLFARDALRIAIATERSGLEFYYARGARSRKDARGRRVFEKLAGGGEGAPRHARGALPRAARSRIRSSSRGRRSCSSRAPPTACSPPAPSSSTKGVNDREALMIGIKCERGSHQLLQALRRAVRGLRGQEDLPRVRRRRARAPRAADPRVPLARRAPARGRRQARRANRAARRERRLTAR